MSSVAIIGGGLVGASVAYRLLQQGAKVTVIDRADAGQATAAGAGILPPLDHFIGIEAMLPLLKAARAHYPELLQVLAADGQSDTGYEVVGALHVATTEEEASRLGAIALECQRWYEAGFGQIGAISELDAGDARRLLPALGPTIVGAVHCAGAARVDGRRLLGALQAAIARRGGTWLRADAELQLGADRVSGIRANGESIEVDALVVAAGAWSHGVAEQLQIDLPVQPQRGQLLHLELRGVDTARWPIVVGFGTNYLVSFPGSRVVAGATRESGVGHDYRLTAGGVHAVLEAALRFAPELANATLRETRIGFRPLSADGMPILGRSATYPNLYFATGHGGYGLELGPYSGALVADLILGRETPVDLAPFSLERFRQNET